MKFHTDIFEITQKLCSLMKLAKFTDKAEEFILQMTSKQYFLKNRCFCLLFGFSIIQNKILILFVSQNKETNFIYFLFFETKCCFLFVLQ